MQNVFRTLTAAIAVVALAGPAIAAQTRHARAPKSRPMATAGTATVATGKIVKFNAASNSVTIATPTGEQEFVLGASSRIREGSRSLVAADLEKLTGREATVRYTESNGQNMVQSLGVARGAKGRKR